MERYTCHKLKYIIIHIILCVVLLHVASSLCVHIGTYWIEHFSISESKITVWLEILEVINPQRACAAGIITVVGLCVCLSVCLLPR